MASLPDALERRTILYGRPRKAPDFKALGDDYRDAGRPSDACEAYEKVADEAVRLASIRELKAQAIKDGDWFMLNRIDRTTETVDPADWLATLTAAKDAGKLRYAHKIALRLGDAPAIEELEKALGIYKAPAPLPEGEADKEASDEEGEAEAEG